MRISNFQFDYFSHSLKTFRSVMKKATFKFGFRRRWEFAFLQHPFDYYFSHLVEIVLKIVRFSQSEWKLWFWESGEELCKTSLGISFIVRFIWSMRKDERNSIEYFVTRNTKNQSAPIFIYRDIIKLRISWPHSRVENYSDRTLTLYEMKLFLEIEVA